MNRKLSRCLLIALYFSPLSGSAQMIDSMMKVYSEKFPQEKVYLQFDKKAYTPGDRIWYKAYLFTGYDPSPYSKNFYAELYDASGNLILRSVSPILESTATGNFDIPVNFEGTRVHIRAYTAWMMNFDTSFVFTRDLRIVGSSQDSATHPEISPTTLHFFPEGGDLIAGVENNIAFKAEDAYGLPRKISGVLYDQTGKNLLTFSSTHNGMGKFLLVPDKQDVFYAIWKDEKGIEHRVDFPAVKTSGIALRVLNASKKMIFSVSRPQESQAYQQVMVIGHMNQQLIYKAIVNLKDVLMSGGDIPTQQLPTGILQITVFDMNQVPLAERVCFVNNQNYSFNANLNVVSKSMQKRGRNAVDIELMENLKTNLSVAITDAEVDGNRSGDDNIITSLLLTGDLRGYVKDPNYYFRNGSDSLAQQLDLVMLTHGWRRFKWEDLAKGKTPQIKYPFENFLSLNAEVLGISPSRIPKDESLNVIFQNKDSATSMFTVPYANNGRFRLAGLIFYDTAKAFYQFNSNRNLSNEAAVIFKNGMYPGTRKLKPYAMTLPSWSADDSSLVRKNRQVFTEASRSREDKKIQSLDVVTVRRRLKSDKQKLDEKYSSGMFSGGNATIFDLENDVTINGSMDLFSYLQGRVAGLNIVTTGPTPTMMWRGSSPSLYLDEMQVDASTVKDMNMNDIAMVKVFAPGSDAGIGNSGGGVISIYTKKGSDRKPDPTIKGLEMARIQGYNPLREFYSPDYLINPEPESDDSRTTLYWNPNLQLLFKGTKKCSITFYNSDVTHRFRIILEGYNEEGKLIHLEKMVE